MKPAEATVETPEGIDATIYRKSRTLPAAEFARFQNKKFVAGLCAEGCSFYGKNWSCPPYSPDFSSYSSSYKYLTLFLFYTDTAHFLSVQDKKYRTALAYNLIRETSWNFINRLEKEMEGLMIPGSPCQLCNVCTVKFGKPCVKPEALRYDFTSLGMQMSRVAEELFDHPLVWYKDANAPKYISCFGGVLTNRQIII